MTRRRLKERESVQWSPTGPCLEVWPFVVESRLQEAKHSFTVKNRGDMHVSGVQSTPSSVLNKYKAA